MGRKKKPEPHINLERWLVSFADFMTLMFAFFVVMFSVSQVDEAKLGKFSESFQEQIGVTVFSGTAGLHDGSSSPFAWIKQDKGMLGQLTQPSDEHLREVEANMRDAIDAYMKARTKGNGDGAGSGAAGEARGPGGPVKLPTPVKKGQGGQPDSNALQGLRILRRRSEIVLRLDVDVAFDSAADAVNPDADEMITVIAGALKDRPVGIRVEGHTDNRPISTAKYRSNWHLSTARATSIINQFVAHGMDPKQLSASGYADNHPVASNSTEEGRAKNRRVDIVVSLAQNESTMLESGTEMREDLDQGMESAKPDDQAKPGK